MTSLQPNPTQHTAPLKILVVDDDSEIRGLLRRFLENHGMTVHAVADAAAAHRMLTRELFSLIILDLSLPDDDGLTVCRRIRESGETTPVIILTARSDLVDRVVGLEMGADDYLTKPFEPRELLSRIKAQVRGRWYAEHARNNPNDLQIVKFGTWELNLGDCLLTNEGKLVNIKPSEKAILRVFATHNNTPLGRDKLITLTRSFGTEINMRSVDVQVARLRKMIEVDPAYPRFIQTVWGVGYVFVSGQTRA